MNVDTQIITLFTKMNMLKDCLKDFLKKYFIFELFDIWSWRKCNDNMQNETF